MTNLYDMERHRLKLYGEMLKNDLVKQKEQQRLERYEKTRQDSLDLQKHLENTKRFQQAKKAQIKDLNLSLQEDNKMLSTMKMSRQIPHTYAEDGQSFLQSISKMDHQRLDKIKRELHQQANQHQHQLSNRRLIQDQINQIERLEDERHLHRIKQWNLDSVKNYQQTKTKHQQNMSLYEKHQRLRQENDNYRDQLESFTNPNHGHNLLDRYNRNQYLQRKANLMEHQSVIKQQMSEFQRRKSQENIDYKKSFGKVENSMLKSVLVKPQTFEPAVYNSELKSQIWQQNQRKMHEKEEKKQKIQMNNIYGGVHGREREGQLKQIDKTLGLSNAGNPLNTSRHSTHKNAYEYQEKKEHSVNHNPEAATDNVSKETPSIQVRQNSRSSRVQPSSRGQYKSFDVISGKNKYYNVQ